VIQTVLGPVEPEQLGIVLPHARVFVDLTSLFVPPREAGERGRAHRPFSLEHLGWIRYHQYFGHFGQESSYFANAPRDMPSDVQRLDVLEHVRGLGLVDRILISHDICTKHRLICYGGHGYSYIPERVARRLRERGFGADEVDAILVANPARTLSFTPLVAAT
jgi:predicted metal-dependent phosphotriesterase family hydrolase